MYKKLEEYAKTAVIIQKYCLFTDNSA